MSKGKCEEHNWYMPRINFRQYAACPYCELTRLTAQLDIAQEALEDMVKWQNAYPVEIFTEPTPEQIDAVCQQLGFGIDRIAAMVLRGYTKTPGSIASSALSRMREKMSLKNNVLDTITAEHKLQ